MPSIPANRAALEQWIRDRYASSAFNICKIQNMPRTDGPAMHIYTQPGATPVLVHKSSVIPLHWRQEVKAGLDTDVARGVLERVPAGTPDTWCTRMVLQPNKSGKHRRTIDLSLFLPRQDTLQQRERLWRWQLGWRATCKFSSLYQVVQCHMCHMCLQSVI